MTGVDWIRAVGGLLQLVGVLAVALGVRETRLEFTDKPGTVKAAGKWIAAYARRLFHRRQRLTLHPEHIESTSTVDAVTVSLRRAWEQLSIEERVDRLNERLAVVERQANDFRSELDREMQVRRAEANAERHARERADEQLRQRISSLAGFGLRLEALGAFFLGFGVVFTTWPAGVADFLALCSPCIGS